MEILGQVFNGTYICASINPILAAVPDVAFLPVALHEAHGVEGAQWTVPDDYDLVVLASRSYEDVNNAEQTTYGSTMVDDDCSSLTGWTSNSTDQGTFTQETFDTKSCFKQYCPAASNDDNASGYRDTAQDFTSADIIEVELDVYFDSFSAGSSDNESWSIMAFDGTGYLNAYFGVDGSGDIKVKTTLSNTGIVADAPVVSRDAWHTIRVLWNRIAGTASVYVDGTIHLEDSADIVQVGGGVNGQVKLYSYCRGSYEFVVYTDFITVKQVTSFSPAEQFKRLSLISQEVESAQSFRQVGMGISGVSENGEILDPQVNLWKQTS